MRAFMQASVPPSTAAPGQHTSHAPGAGAQGDFQPLKQQLVMAQVPLQIHRLPHQSLQHR